MSLLEVISENEAIKWGINAFLKTAMVLGVVGMAVFFLEKAFSFTFDISAGFGL